MVTRPGRKYGTDLQNKPVRSEFITNKINVQKNGHPSESNKYRRQLCGLLKPGKLDKKQKMRLLPW
jgi:hypothetical protein